MKELSNISNQYIHGETEPLYLFRCNNITIENCFTVQAVNCTNIHVLKCKSSNVGRNFVQFDKVDGGLIAYNWISGPGPDVEDIISVYMSHNITVLSNNLRGHGISKSGSGIMVGDTGGSNISVLANTVINTGNCGIGVSGGDSIYVANNRVTSRQSTISNVGIYAWAQNGVTGSNVTFENNQVAWLNANGKINNYWEYGNIPGIVLLNNKW